jgi:hypothetical protein
MRLLPLAALRRDREHVPRAECLHRQYEKKPSVWVEPQSLTLRWVDADECNSAMWATPQSKAPLTL